MTRTLARFTVLVFALTLSITAFAAPKAQNVTFTHDLQLNGKTLPAGYYTVQCDTSGPNPEVKFLRNGKEVATATGQTKQLNFTPDYNQVVTTGGSGSLQLSEIDFAKSTTAVTFESGAMSSAGGN